MMSGLGLYAQHLPGQLAGPTGPTLALAGLIHLLLRPPTRAAAFTLAASLLVGLGFGV